MSGDYRLRPPVACRCLLRGASLIVPPKLRSAWCHPRDANLNSLRILAERGELPGSESDWLAWWCRDTLEDAFLTRCRVFDIEQWVRSPSFVMAASAFALLLIAIATHGFAITRSLADANENRLVANLFPIAFALMVGLIAAAGRICWRGHSWCYRAFLFLKILMLAVIVPLLWIEGGAALRGGIANQTVRVLTGGVALAIVFVASFGWSVLWSLADQRQRCPVCLRRLVIPVRIGSCASIFEPAVTEWICDAGHGSLCMCEVEDGEPDRWVELAATVEHS